MEFIMKFDMDNAAFKVDEPGMPENGEICRFEVAKILKRVAAEVDNGWNDHNIKDTNGNTVGSWYFQPNVNEDDL